MSPSERHNAEALAAHLKQTDEGADELEGRGFDWTYDLWTIESAFYGQARGTFDFVAKVEEFADLSRDDGPMYDQRRYVIGSPVWVAETL
jgi:hypothetical protein